MATKYKVNWDNGASACGTFPQAFDTQGEAQAFADDWATTQNAEADVDPNDPQDDDRCYAAEVIEEESDDEPEEGDITTTDHRHFYQDGKLRFTLTEKDNGKFDMHVERYQSRLAMTVKDFRTVEDAVNEYMQIDQFFPNCWFISDHGNAHLMEVA